jgi:DNA-binding PadR family transcriptional regulator
MTHPFGSHPGARGGPFGPDFGSRFGPGARGNRGWGRTRRGGIRAAILALLAEGPVHGYEMIQEIDERSNGLWRPSPGSVYPMLQRLVNEGLIVAADSEGSKRLYELTDDGRKTAAKTQTPPWEAMAEGAHLDELNMRSAFSQLASAMFQAWDAATPEQQKRIVDVANSARREIYAILGEA